MSRVKCATTMCPTTSDDSLHSPSAIQTKPFCANQELTLLPKRDKDYKQVLFVVNANLSSTAQRMSPLSRHSRHLRGSTFISKSPPLYGARLMSILGFHLSFPVLMCWQAWLSCASLHFSLLYEYQHMSIPI